MQDPLLSSVRTSNDQHRNWVCRRLQENFQTFKANHCYLGSDLQARDRHFTPISLRELCNWLLEQDVQLQVHDPAAGDLPPEWSGFVTRMETPLKALEQADALVVATEWPEYKEVNATALAELVKNLVLLMLTLCATP